MGGEKGLADEADLGEGEGAAPGPENEGGHQETGVAGVWMTPAGVRARGAGTPPEVSQPEKSPT